MEFKQKYPELQGGNKPETNVKQEHGINLFTNATFSAVIKDEFALLEEHFNLRNTDSSYFKTEQDAYFGIPLDSSTSRGVNIAKNVQCTQCFKSFKRKANLKRHVLCHTGIKPFRCDVCEKRFTDKSNLVKHSLVHTGEKHFRCNVCEKRFFQRSDFVRHLRVHTGERPFVCVACGRSFRERSNLNAHVKRQRCPKRPPIDLQCLVCSKLFQLQADRDRRTLNNKTNNSVQCNACKQQFGGMSDLEKHVNVCVDAMRFPYARNCTDARAEMQDSNDRSARLQCHICWKLFQRKDHLRRHIFYHKGIKPFPCTVCEKHFTEKSSLIRHLRVHTGEKPFTCYMCGHSYREKWDLNVHLKSMKCFSSRVSNETIAQ